MSQSELASPQVYFFPVSMVKLAVMSVCTIGLYQTYWFYCNRRLLKRRENRCLSAPWRSVVGIVFALPLFRLMARPAGRYALGLALACFVVWLALSLAGYGPAPWAALSLASVLPLLPLQALANRVNEQVAPGHHQNSGLHGWNIVAVLVGGLLATLTILGLALLSAKA